MTYPVYHPIFLNLEQRKVLIVGGGAIALEKVASLVPSGAKLMVLSPEINESIDQLRSEGKLVWIQGIFSPESLEGYFMVIAATDDPEVNAQIFQLADDRNMLVNSVDDPDHCNFIMAAIAKSGPLQVAISSSGTSPALAQLIRGQIARDLLTEEAGELAKFLGSNRDLVKASLPHYRVRKGFWERVLASDIPEILATSGVEEAEVRLKECLTWSVANVDCVGCGNPGRFFGCCCRESELIAVQ